jgi:hypothetical protein
MAFMGIHNPLSKLRQQAVQVERPTRLLNGVDAVKIPMELCLGIRLAFEISLLDEGEPLEADGRVEFILVGPICMAIKSSFQRAIFPSAPIREENSNPGASRHPQPISPCPE